MLRVSDVVVLMGCGDVYPVFLARHEDWPVDDPAGQDIGPWKVGRRDRRELRLERDQ